MEFMERIELLRQCALQPVISLEHPYYAFYRSYKDHPELAKRYDRYNLAYAAGFDAMTPIIEEGN